MSRNSWLIVVAVFLLLVHRSYAPPDLGCPSCDLEVRINVFEHPGKVVFDRVPNAEFYYIEWAPSADGPWTNFTGGMGAWLDNIPAAGVGAITASVPMFYRVKAWVPTNLPPVPAGMVRIEGGSFVMGGMTNRFPASDSFPDELPQRSVRVDTFFMDRYEVTKGLWDDVRSWAIINGYALPAGSGKGTNHPVHSIQWDDAIRWCNARSEREGLVPAYYTDPAFTNVYRSGVTNPFVLWVANGYRLPTEAEWEKAARGGSTTRRFPWPDSDQIQHAKANYFSRTNEVYDISQTRGYHPAFNDGVIPYTSPVGHFPPNGFGLHDMAGNVWEWCWDWYQSDFYINGSTNNPGGPPAGTSRVRRGGSWDSYAFSMPAANRFEDSWPPPPDQDTNDDGDWGECPTDTTEPPPSECPDTGFRAVRRP